MDDNTYNLYERYFNEELTNEEKKSFEYKFENDVNFRKGYEDFLEVVDIIKSSSLKLELENDPEIKAIRNKYSVKPIKESHPLQREKEVPSKIIPIYKKPMFKFIAVAASILLIFAVYWIVDTHIKVNKLYASLDILKENIKASNQLSNEFQKNIDNDNIGFSGNADLYKLKDGIDAFHDRKFDKACGLLEDYINSGATFQLDVAHYYLGECYRIKENWNEARPHFQTINDNNAEYYNRKYMSLILTLLQLREKEQAKDAARKIINNEPNDTTYITRARKLIKELK